MSKANQNFRDWEEGLCPRGCIWYPYSVCLQVTLGEARRAGRRRAPLSRPCRPCSGFVFWQLPCSVVFLPSEIAFAKVNMPVLVCVPGKFKQIDDQLKEHSPSLCTMSDSQWNQDSWWVRIRQNRTAWNVCIHSRVCVCVCAYARVFPQEKHYNLYHFSKKSVR